ncbi:MAG: type II 3-dehydroquinate dehydratase [Bacteroidota bacterium]|nr:type II 3-dehydroquinate dehydratase [Bacteroidota bacterium]
MKVLILNGPNLNLLGRRETNIYGNVSFDEYLQNLKIDFPTLEIDYYQSNIEGVLIDKLHQAQELDYKAIIFNAGAYTHTSIALMDAVRSIAIPVIEVHISNTFSRESFRHKSYLSSVVRGVIVGFGLDSYRLALQSLL